MALTLIQPSGINSTANFTFAGVTVTGVSNLGANGNVVIAGGSNGQALITDGNGNLSWTTVSSTSISNGNSNVNIPAANGNVNISVAGNSNILTVTGTGINVAGYINAIGNAAVGNLSTNNVSAINLSGTLTTAAQPNITSLGTLGSLTATGNITAGNANLGNSVSANFFIGAGNLLTNVSAVSISNGTSAIDIPVANGNINFSANGNANILVITGSNAVLNGNIVTGNGTGGNITGANIISANTGNFATNLNVSGNVVIGGNLTVDGNLIYVNVTDLSVEDPIIQLQTGPNGTPPSSNTGKDVGTALNYFDTSAKIAWMGWDVSNAEIAFGANVGISSEVVTFTSLANIRAGNAQLGNTATANFISGTLTTASQPNITSLGTLGSLNVSGLSNLGPVGNVTITGGSNGQVLTTNGSGGLSWTTASGAGGGASISNGNSNVNIATANGNITMSVAGNSNIVVVTGTGINVAGTGNITGNLNAANVTIGVGSGGNLSGANVITANTFVGTFANGNSDIAIPAANGNILFDVGGNSNVLIVTSTGINVAGVGNFTGNLNAPNVIIGAGVGGNLTGANIISANTANFGVALNVTGLSNLGPVGNVTITGGSNGQVLTTNGSGGLSWTTVTGGGGASISNGNSNVNIATANGNVTISSAGNANILIATGTGVNVAGTGNFSGNLSAANASLGNLVTANFLSGVLTTASQPNITSLGTLGSLTTTGNVSVGNRLTVLGTSDFGPIGNVTITGGSNGQVLTTNGLGGLSWTTVSGGGGGNGAPLGSVSDNFTGNGVQTTFTLSTTPGNINLTYVNYNGALLQRSTYSLSGANLIFSAAPANGSLIEVTTLSGTAGISYNYSRSSQNATAGQTVFSVVYVIGYIQVYLNGVLLNSSDYTASNGTTVVLADPAALNDLLEFITFTTTTPVNTTTATFNSTNLNSNLAITAGYSAVSVGPISIANGVSVTIADGQKWVIL